MAENTTTVRSWGIARSTTDRGERYLDPEFMMTCACQNQRNHGKKIASSLKGNPDEAIANGRSLFRADPAPLPTIYVHD